MYRVIVHRAQAALLRKTTRVPAAMRGRCSRCRAQRGCDRGRRTRQV